ncbi:hypothetical protein PI124_g588 [Phytophthora idaei]|nr:hypothetical protein PI124_g588 [Phytophthora idaei]
MAMTSNAFFGSSTVDLRVCLAICSVMLISFLMGGVARPPEQDGGTGVDAASSIDRVEDRRCAGIGNKVQLLLLFPVGVEFLVSRIAPVDGILGGGTTAGEDMRIAA